MVLAGTCYSIDCATLSYIKNRGVPQSTISNLIDLLPPLFDLPNESKVRMSKLNSPHFLGYSGFAEETTLGKKHVREQFDFAIDLSVVWQEHEPERKSAMGNQASIGVRRYWRLCGSNQWPLRSSRDSQVEACCLTRSV